MTLFLTAVPMTHPEFTDYAGKPGGWRPDRWGDATWQHHAVMSLFGELGNGPAARANGDVLFRAEPEHGRLLVQSSVTPTAPELRTTSLDPVLASIEAGTPVQALLVANTVRTINRTGPDGTTRTHRARIPDTHLEGWLKDRLAGAAEPEGHVVAESGELRRGKSQLITTTFRFNATVVDPDALARLCRDGVGRAKAYGCGMLSVLPVRA